MKTKLKGRSKVVNLTEIKKPNENMTLENLTDKRDK